MLDPKVQKPVKLGAQRVVFGRSVRHHIRHSTLGTGGHGNRWPIHAQWSN